MVNSKSTVEQVEAYLAALTDEKAGYEARIAAAKVGKQERLSVEELEARVGQVEAEAKRAKGLLKKAGKDAAE